MSTAARVGVMEVLALAGALLACGGGLPRKVEEPQRADVSFVYGYVDMEDAPTSLDWMQFKRVAPTTETPYYDMRIDHGAFYAEYLPPGSYALDSFGSNGGIFSKPTTYAVPLQDNPLRFVIRQPGIYFLGSFRCVTVKTGMFEANKYDLVPAPSPSEGEILAKILPNVEGTSWKGRLEGRAGQ